MVVRIAVILLVAAVLGPTPARAAPSPPCDGTNTLGLEPELLCDIQNGLTMIYAGSTRTRSSTSGR